MGEGANFGNVLRIRRRIHRAQSKTGILYVPSFIIDNVLNGKYEVIMAIYNDHIEIWPVGDDDDKDKE